MISVIIATYNRADLLKRQLQRLVKQTISKELFEVIIVDDGSTDDTPSVANDFATRLSNVVFLRQENKGPACARNKGAEVAKGEVLAFTDDDCLVALDWLDVIFDSFMKKDIVGLQGKTFSNKSLMTPLTHQVQNEQGDSSVPTCNAAYRKDLFSILGGFDESFSFQNEDADLAWRMMEQGAVEFEPMMLVYHPPRSDSFQRNARKMKNYASEFYLFHKNPERYRKYRFESPWHTIYKEVMLGTLVHHFVRRIKFIDRPWLMIQGFALSAIWWWDLIFHLPEFMRLNAQFTERRAQFTEIS